MISVLAISTIMFLCICGIVHHRYADNLFQRFGLALLFIGYWPKLVYALENRENPHVILDVGIAVFAIGTAYKVWKHRPPKFPPRPLTPDEAKQVYGGHK